MEDEKIVGVITGDLINSSTLSDKKKNLLRLELERFQTGNTDIQLPLQFYRGDSFQLMVAKEKAARVAVTIEAIVFSITGSWVRLSIGIGSVSKISAGNVLQSEGEAFQLSGHQMDKMREEGRMIKIALNCDQLQPIFSASFYLVECIIWSWKPGQVAVIAKIPFSKTQKEIAIKLNISEAAVSKAIKASNWPAIENFIRGYEETIKEIYK